MALIKCPECGKKVSDKANACIHCGYPLDEEEDFSIADLYIRKKSLLDEDTLTHEIHKIADDVLKSMKEKEVRSPFPLFGYGYHW